MAISLISTVVAWLLATIAAWSYLGIFLLMAIESSIIPFPSEAIMIPAGALAAQGNMNIILAFVCGVAGNVFGAILSYWFAFLVGRKGIESLSKKYGKYIFLSEKSLKHADTFFENHGHITIFIARLIPGVRHLISLPAGFTKMNQTKFIAYTALGSAVWCVVLLSLGFILQTNSALIQKYLSQITIITAIFCVLLVLVYIWRRAARKKSARAKR